MIKKGLVWSKILGTTRAKLFYLGGYPFFAVTGNPVDVIVLVRSEGGDPGSEPARELFVRSWGESETHREEEKRNTHTLRQNKGIQVREDYTPRNFSIPHVKTRGLLN